MWQNLWKNVAIPVDKWGKICGKIGQNPLKNGAKSVEKWDRSLAVPGTSLCNPVQVQGVDLGVILDASLMVFILHSPGERCQGHPRVVPAQSHPDATKPPLLQQAKCPQHPAQNVGGDRNAGTAQQRVFNIKECSNHCSPRLWGWNSPWIPARKGLGPRQSREGAFPNYPPLVVCPSSFNPATPSGKLKMGF